jgi:hypothetical protein
LKINDGGNNVDNQAEEENVELDVIFSEIKKRTCRNRLYIGSFYLDRNIVLESQ